MALQLVDDWYISVGASEYITDRTMQQHNVLRIWAYCKMYGWTAEACAGALGNFRYESTFNPAIWQGRGDPPSDILHTSRGVGLPQWTTTDASKPQKYTSWCARKGLDYRLGASNMYYLLTEDEHGGNWQKPTASYAYHVTWGEYIKLSDDVRKIAKTFWQGYERSAAPDLDARADEAEYWYGIITTEPTPIVPPLPITPVVTLKPWLLFQFNRSRRAKRRLIIQ